MTGTDSGGRRESTAEGLVLRLGRWLREPWFGFLLLGGTVFAIDAWRSGPDLDLIRVDAPLVDALVNQHRLLEGYEPGAEQVAALVQRYIDEEVMVRHAYARGLDLGDGRIRQQLLGKMNFLLEQEPGEPTAEQLHALFAASPEAYRKPAEVDLLQRDADAAQGSGAGERLYGVRFAELSPEIGEIAAKAVISGKVGTWHGPYRLNDSEIMLQILASRPSAPYDAGLLEQYLREDWRIQQRLALRREALDEMRREYRIELAPNLYSHDVAGR